MDIYDFASREIAPVPEPRTYASSGVVVVIDICFVTNRTVLNRDTETSGRSRDSQTPTHNRRRKILHGEQDRPTIKNQPPSFSQHTMSQSTTPNAEPPKTEPRLCKMGCGFFVSSLQGMVRPHAALPVPPRSFFLALRVKAPQRIHSRAFPFATHGLLMPAVLSRLEWQCQRRGTVVGRVILHCTRTDWRFRRTSARFFSILPGTGTVVWLVFGACTSSIASLLLFY
jgi:hypothetical protein